MAIDKSKNNNNNEDIANQIVKLLNYFYSHYNIQKYATNVDIHTFYEEFISIATLQCLNKARFYDSEKGKLSTFVYMLFNCNLYLWVNMANHGHSYNEARALYKMQKETKQKSDYEGDDSNYYATPIVPYSYDSLTNINADGEGAEKSFIEYIIDPDMNTESDVLRDMTYNKVIEHIKTTDILSKTQRKYILKYLNPNSTIQSIANNYGVSRQAVEQAIKIGAKKLRKDKFIQQCYDKN